MCKEFNTIRTLHKLCFDVDSLPRDPNVFWWLITCGGEPAGFGGYQQSHQFSNAIYLCRSGVLKGYRGNNLQKKLIRVRINHAKKLGYEWAVTDTRDNPASVNSLISCGFKNYEPINPWAFSNSMYWRKEL